MIGRLDLDFGFYFVLFLEKMVIQKTKVFFNHICIIITFIYLSKSIIKSCINEPVENFNPVLSPNFEFLCPIRLFAYLGILAVKAANTNIKKDCP